MGAGGLVGAEGALEAEAHRAAHAAAEALSGGGGGSDGAASTQPSVLGSPEASAFSSPARGSPALASPRRAARPTRLARLHACAWLEPGVALCLPPSLWGLPLQPEAAAQWLAAVRRGGRLLLPERAPCRRT